MGQKLCCFRPPATEKNQPRNHASRNPNPKETNSLSDHDSFSGVESTVMTLEDYLILSPALNPHQCIRGGEISVLKQPNKRVYPSSPYFDNAHFHTPAMSFSSGKLEKIEEFGEDDDEEVSRKSILSRSGGSSMKKKVSFKLPEEADVIVFYSPEETIDA